MILHPCRVCRRHVAATEPACPFCGGELGAAHRPDTPSLGRMSRAAVFASATLAGCWSQSAPQQTTPPETNVAKPPDEAKPAETNAEVGSIQVTVLDSSTREPQHHTMVNLTGPGLHEQQVLADLNGIATFNRLAPGTYTVTLPSDNPRQRSSQRVTVTAGQTTQTNLFVLTQHHQPMPYGAPPARRRIV